MSELRGRLAGQVRKNRNRRRQSVDGLSAQIGLSSKWLQTFERGDVDPKLSSLEALANALGYSSVVALLAGDQPRPPGWARADASDVVAGALDGEEHPMKRRQFLAGLGASAVLAGVSDPDRLTSLLKGAAALDRHVVDQFAHATRMFEDQAPKLGHRPLLHLVQAHGAHLERLLGGSMGSKLRARLLSVAGETAVLEATLLWYLGDQLGVGRRLQSAPREAPPIGAHYGRCG